MSSVYPDLTFPPAPEDRPTVFVNMVATIDGKILSGERDETVHDLGSDLDHATMKQIQAQADAVLIGMGSLVATPGLTYNARLLRFVATRSGRVNPADRFWNEPDPDQAFAITPIETSAILPEGIQAISMGSGDVDWPAVFRTFRQDMGIARLLVEGGSELNAALMKLDLVDELFLTLAPKIKLGRDVPTYADGEPLDRTAIQNYDLVSCLPVEGEVFLRYRRRR